MSGDKETEKEGELHAIGPLTKHGKEAMNRIAQLEKEEPGFMPKLERIAAKLGTRSEWLLNVMMMESSLDAHRMNKKSSATGLIQFMANTSAKLGTSREALIQMTAVQQLDYVERYYWPFRGRLTSQSAVYAAVGRGQVHESDDAVLFTAGSKGYNANKGWDVNGDGKITQGELGQVAARFGAGTQFTVGNHGKTTEPTKEEPKPELAPVDNSRVEVKVGEIVPVQPGHLIYASVGRGGQNHAPDIAAVQQALVAHGHEVVVDAKIGTHTIAAIESFQAGLMHKPDGLIEVGKTSEKHLMDAPTSATKPQTTKTDKPTTEAKTDAKTEVPISEHGGAQMGKLESAASSVRGRHPLGKCYHAVKEHIIAAGGYGNIRNVFTDARFAGEEGYAHQFADTVNRDPAKFGLERVGVSTPYDAPTGSIVVVAHGSPGTKHPTAGDITVKGPGDEFYNDGSMGYHGRAAWPPKHGGVLGVYKPR